MTDFSGNSLITSTLQGRKLAKTEYSRTASPCYTPAWIFPWVVARLVYKHASTMSLSKTVGSTSLSRWACPSIFMCKTCRRIKVKSFATMLLAISFDSKRVKCESSPEKRAENLSCWFLVNDITGLATKAFKIESKFNQRDQRDYWFSRMIFWCVFAAIFASPTMAVEWSAWCLVLTMHITKEPEKRAFHWDEIFMKYLYEKFHMNNYDSMNIWNKLWIIYGKIAYEIE